jgi:hypothetical protein
MMPPSSSGSRVSTSVVKMRAALPATFKPHDMTDSMPALPRRQLSTIWGSRLPSAIVRIVDACSAASIGGGHAGDSSHADSAASEPKTSTATQPGAWLKRRMRAMSTTSCTQHAATSPNVLNA